MGQTEEPISAPATAAGADPLVGMKLGDYVVESAVASGGMGIVYRARHPLLGRYAAVKVLRPEHAKDEESIARFLKEAQAISAIHHRGIIDVHNFGHLEDGRQYMVMEFLEGETLEEVLNRDAPLPAARALPIIDEILDALSAAHKVGVVHRDMKPSNVFITRESNGTRYAKLVDFGLAKQSEPISEGEEQAFAKASLVAGTPEYISPEQARGLMATPRTDLYCLGVMVFEMLTGKLPFAAKSVGEMLKLHVYEPAPRMSSLQSNLPAALDDLVAELLEKDPEKRPQSADVVRQAVGRVQKQLKEESTRQAVLPKEQMLQAMTPTRRVDDQERRAVATTDVVSRKPPTTGELAVETGPGRKGLVLVAMALLVLVGGGLLLVREWGKVALAPPGVLISDPIGTTGGAGTRPRAEVLKAVAEAARQPVVVEPAAEQPEPVAVAPVRQPEEDLAMPRPKPVKIAVPKPTPVVITSTECEVTEKWKAEVVQDLKDMGRLAAVDDATSAAFDKQEAALTQKVNAATSKSDCVVVDRELAELRSRFQKK